jgi:hypothetical protein
LYTLARTDYPCQAMAEPRPPPSPASLLQEFPLFHTSNNGRVEGDLSEFTDAEEVVRGVAQEYEACESADYVSAAYPFLRSDPTLS